MSCKTFNMKSSKENFTNGKYQVLSLKEKEFSDKDDYKIFIDTTQQYISGKFDCNNFSVEYEIKEDNTLDFGFAKATKMYCEGEMDLENKFFGILNDVTYFKYNDGDLSFYNKNKDLVLKLKKIKNRE